MRESTARHNEPRAYRDHSAEPGLRASRTSELESRVVGVDLRPCGFGMSLTYRALLRFQRLACGKPIGLL